MSWVIHLAGSNTTIDLEKCQIITLQPDRLRLELARRGWSAADLAREARVSPPTVSAALAGRPIAAQSLALIAGALSRGLVVPTIDVLLG